MKLKVTLANGLTQEVEARKFSHYIGNTRYWFAYHKAVDRIGLTVSHLDSGKRIDAIPAGYVLACLRDEKAAAKMTIDKLVERAGIDKVRSVLNAAEKAVTA